MIGAQATSVIRPDSDSRKCVLLFSGGRDSAIAAVRLAKKFAAVELLTITSDHLVGVKAVHQRLDELSRLGLPRMKWTRVRQLPAKLEPSTQDLATSTCLPCQQNYLFSAVLWARRENARSIAMGYARYQSDWPEQTPLAAEMMANVLGNEGIQLELPVYDLDSKQQAQAQLREIGLSEESLEQKCIKQIFNRPLSMPALEQQVELIRANLTSAFAMSTEIPLEVLEQREVG